MNHNERLVDTYRKTLSDVNCVSGHHVNKLPDPYKSQALVYMRQMRDHLEQEFARLGETGDKNVAESKSNKINALLERDIWRNLQCDIADFEMEYGQPWNWSEEVTREFDGKWLEIQKKFPIEAIIAELSEKK